MRIADLSKRRTAAHAVLDEMLLSDAEATARDAEAVAVREALRSMEIRNNSEGTGLVAFTNAGDPLPVSAMTEAQRQAFAHMASS